MPKVITRIIGGIGNQLFAYAAARRLAIANDAELIIDDVSGFLYDTQFQRHYQLDHFSIPCRKCAPVERLEPFSRVRRNLLRRLNHYRSFDQRSYIKQQGMDFDPRLLSVRFTNKVYLEGTWQSERYFKDVEPQIREDLELQSPMDNANKAMALEISVQTSVAVHVRYFDEPKQETFQGSAVNNAPAGYYQRAIAEMEERVSNAHYFVFSDYPSAASALISLPRERVTFVQHNHSESMAYADLWLMTQCQHFIIANSTFSWWGAWLAKSSQKIVICPSFEKRTGVSFWGFEGLIPNTWIKI